MYEWWWLKIKSCLFAGWFGLFSNLFFVENLKNDVRIAVQAHLICNRTFWLEIPRISNLNPQGTPRDEVVVLAQIR